MARILKGREYSMVGGWVGDGRHIFVFKDAWIPTMLQVCKRLEEIKLGFKNVRGQLDINSN